MIEGFCPLCEKHSISSGVCTICERDFRTGNLVMKRIRRVAGSYALPSIREALPNRLARCFREPKPKNCGLVLKR